MIYTMNKITAHSLDLQPSQKLDLPIGARLLTVNVDHRFNKCLLWTLQDSDAETEAVTFTMSKLNETATGDYIGTFKDNSGYLHVFAQKPQRPDVVTAAARFERETAQAPKTVAPKVAKTVTTAGTVFTGDQFTTTSTALATT